MTRAVRSRAVLASLLLVLAACTSAPAIPHETLTSNPEPLRARFNRDAGHVRVVMLAAPT